MGNGSYGSLSGKVIRTRGKKPQVNPSPCSECGAGKGQPCFRNVPGRGLRNLARTHRVEAERKRLQAPAPKPAPKKRRYNGRGLGPLIRVYPKRLRLDKTPRLEEGQAYVTADRNRYHPKWCTEVITAGRRTTCAICQAKFPVNGD